VKSPTLMQQNKAPVAEIRVGHRLRPVSEAGVDSLIASITETGVMKDAIHVRKKRDGGLWLIAGAHRLEAARRLGWEEIEVKVWTDVTDDWSRLMEIDDNLAGAEMNALDSAVFLATRKEVYERLHPEVRHGGDRRSPAFKDQTDIMSVRSFANSTAEKFGLTERHVRRMIAAGTALGPDQVTQLRRAPRPVRLVDLMDIAKMQPVDRYDVVARLSAGEARSAAEARRALAREQAGEPPVKDPVDEELMALVRAWSRARITARRRFVAEAGADLAQLLAEASGARDGGQDQ